MNSAAGFVINVSRHPVYWFEDGLLLLQVHDVVFRVHRDFFYGRSRVIRDLPIVDLLSNPYSGLQLGNDTSGCIYHVFGSKIRVEDVEALLEHLYHDCPLLPDASFDRIASVLRASSPRGLDFPSIHELSKMYLTKMFPDVPEPHFRVESPDEALALALEFGSTSIHRRLFYSFVTSASFDAGESIPGPTSEQNRPSAVGQSGVSDGSLDSDLQVPPSHILTAHQLQKCTNLMTKLIDHFTPTLFTPATTPHMACTDVLAETWMSLVIQPALADDGVYKPLETLERMKSLDWASHGLCADCVREKRAEWNDEQQVVWNLIGDWLSINSAQGSID